MKKLETYNRGMVPLYQVYIPIKAINQIGINFTGVKFSTVIFAHHQNKVWFSWGKEEIDQVGQKIWEITSTKEGKEEHLTKMKEVLDKAKEAASKVREMDLAKLSNLELIKVYQELYTGCKEAHAWANTDIDAIVIVPADLFKGLLLSSLPQLTDKEFNDIYSRLTAPIYSSYVAEEEKALLKLLVRLKEQGLEINQLKESSLYPELKKIISRFWWTCLGWENQELKSEDDYLADLKEYEKTIEDPTQKIIEINTKNDKLKLKREELIAKYNLSEEIRHRLEVFDEYALFQELRKEMHTMVLYSFQLLLKEVAIRFNLSVQKLNYYTLDEVIALLSGEKIYSEEEFKQKELAQFCLDTGEKVEVYVGQEALAKINEYYPSEIKEVTELKGTSSSPGVVQGKVKVCLGIKEATTKMKTGDILVTAMTTPDYVPVMRKASAIVTNEGGITCHAAIVARELGIPCITSTKIATEVLKDEELVEVDANHGLVKIIK